MVRLIRGKVIHQRRKPFIHGLKFVNYMWLIDLNEEQPNYVKKRLLAKDHFGGEAKDMRDAVEIFAKSNNEVIDATDKIYMVTSIRNTGYVFNPLTVYWCIDKNNQYRWAILEIHNTYGDRHAHIVKPDKNGNSRMAKEFYVSPFLTVEGDYQVRTVLTDQKVVISVNLLQNEVLVFSASFVGEIIPANIKNRLLARIRTPFATLQAMMRIRAHGIWLWIRRLPVVPRPNHPKQEGML